MRYNRWTTERGVRAWQNGASEQGYVARNPVTGETVTGLTLQGAEADAARMARENNDLEFWLVDNDGSHPRLISAYPVQPGGWKAAQE